MGLYPPKNETEQVSKEKAYSKTPIRLLLVAVIVLWLISNIAIFLPYEKSYGLSNSLRYMDYRYWPKWVSNCCWLILIWAGVQTLLSIFVPKNAGRSILIRRAFYQTTTSLLFLYLIVAVWFHCATLSLATIVSPCSDYIYNNYTIPLADYYTTGEGQVPFFWPTVFILSLTVAFISWRLWHHFGRRKKTLVTSLLLMTVLLPTLGADEVVVPKKVETSVGIYDVNSKDDLLSFSAEDIRKLVKMEDDRTRGAGKTPHPVLVYCFEEKSFRYTGGKYNDTEIKYRLHTPAKIVQGKKYPLAIHLHGIGEGGKDNALSLAHLHSILPLLCGPEQQDFFLLVLQCPPDNRVWTSKPENDGNLDIAIALTDHVIQNNPIDEKRLSLFGLSSGGYGVWQWLLKEPHRFAAAVAASKDATKKSDQLRSLNKTSVWSFHNKGDSKIHIDTLRKAQQAIEEAGGFMKITIFDQGGHAAWRPAMDEYNCFSWMIAQKRGGWFNPPPERKVYQGRSLSESFYAFFMPLLLAGGLFIFQRMPLCERLHERVADRLYRRHDDGENDEEEDEEDEEDESDESPADDFRILTDATGTKKIKAKIVGFQGDAARIESPDGKIAMVPIKHFSEADRKVLRELREPTLPADGFRVWTDTTGSKKITAKLVEFLSDGKIRLESETGKVMTVDPKFFCEDDQKWLQERQPTN